MMELPPTECALLVLIIDYLDDLSKASETVLEAANLNVSENYFKQAKDLLRKSLSPGSKNLEFSRGLNLCSTINVNRYYRLNGLAGKHGNNDDPTAVQEDEAIDKHVSLAEAVQCGMKVIGARTRVDAEVEIEKQALFREFLTAVKTRGYFHEPMETYESKYTKVVTKFRLKLRDKALDDTDMSSSMHELSRSRSLSQVSQRVKVRGTFSRQDQRYMEQAEQHKVEGNEKMQAKDYQGAVVSYSFALDIVSQVGNATHGDVKYNKSIYYSNRSAAYLSLSQFSLAEDDARASLALNETYGKALFRLGLSQYFQERYDVALEYFLQAKTNGEENNPTTAQYIQKTYDKLQVGPGDNTDGQLQSNSKAEIFKMQGNSYMGKKMYDKAVDSYTRAIDVARDNDRNLYVYYSNRAAALCFMQDYQGAAEDAAIATELKPDYGKAYARLGLSLFFLERYRESRDAYASALRYEPSNKASLSYMKKAEEKIEEGYG